MVPSQRTVLVVDDQADMRHMLQQFLSAEGYGVITADGGRAALSVLAEHQVDCIVLDLCMPGMTGIEVARRVRADTTQRWTPILFLTGTGDEADRRAALEAGAEDLLSKPFDRLALQVRLRNLIRLKSMHDELLDANRHLEGVVRSRTQQIRHASREMAELHRQLVDASRLAGMAEVATGVLHDVGNLLNSLNVTLSLLGERCEKWPVPLVQRVSDLLAAKGDGVGEFLDNDPQGRKVPAFMARVAETLTADHANLRTELDCLSSDVDQLKQIVRMQQALGVQAGAIEVLRLEETVEQVLRLQEIRFERHGVAVFRMLSDSPPIPVMRHRLLQILVNLVNNAYDAVTHESVDNPRITVRSGYDDGRVWLEVGDNGIGIDPDHARRVFDYGFTTKKGGHGFGMHSSSMAARDMGGRLTFESAGVGHGAKFSLELPRLATSSELNEDRRGRHMGHPG